MINLLPPGQRNAVEREYKFRLGSAYILLLSIAVFVGVVLLLPSYFFIDVQEDLVLQELGELHSSSENAEQEAIKEELRVTNEYLQILTLEEDRTFIYLIIKKISEHSLKEIEITSITYGRAKEKGTSIFSVGGTATTRKALLAFKKSLEGDELFDEVILPVSSLAKDENLSFKIQIKGIF